MREEGIERKGHLMPKHRRKSTYPKNTSVLNYLNESILQPPSSFYINVTFLMMLASITLFKIAVFSFSL